MRILPVIAAVTAAFLVVACPYSSAWRHGSQ